MKNLIKNPFLTTLLSVGFISLLYITLTFTDGDEGRYLYLAEAIANGQGQSDVHLPTPKSEALTPPGYPYLISLMVKGEALTVFWPKAFSWFFYLAYSLVVLGLFKSFRDIQPKQQLVLALIALLPVSVLIYSWSIFAETIYLLLSGLVLLSVMKEESTVKEAMLTGFLIALSMAIRPVGLAFIPAIGLHYLWRKKWIPLLCCALVFLIAYAPVVLFTYKALGVPFGYISHYASDQTIIEKILNLLHTISIILPHYLFVALPQTLYFSLFDGDCLLAKLQLSILIRPLTICLGLIMVLGFLIRLRKLHFFDLYALVYLPMVSTYHVALQRGIEDRYLLPILPHAVFYLFIGLQCLLSKVRSQKKWIQVFFSLSLIYAVLTALIVGGIRLKREINQQPLSPFSPQRHLNIPLDAHQAFGRYLEAASWIKENSPKDSVVVSRKPRHTYLMAERSGFRLVEVRELGETPFETISRHLSYGPVYILQDAYPEDSSYGRDRRVTIDPMLVEHAEHFKKVHTTGTPVTTVWKLEATAL